MIKKRTRNVEIMEEKLQANDVGKSLMCVEKRRRQHSWGAVREGECGKGEKEPRTQGPTHVITAL